MAFITPSRGLGGPVREQHLDGAHQALDLGAQRHHVGGLANGDPVGLSRSEIPADVPAGGLEGGGKHIGSVS